MHFHWSKRFSSRSLATMWTGPKTRPVVSVTWANMWHFIIHRIDFSAWLGSWPVWPMWSHANIYPTYMFLCFLSLFLACLLAIYAMFEHSLPSAHDSMIQSGWGPNVRTNRSKPEIFWKSSLKWTLEYFGFGGMWVENYFCLPCFPTSTDSIYTIR